MKKMRLFERAIRIASEAHRNQFDKAGLPYILHPIRVAEAMDDETHKIVAILHDVIEDTSITPTYLSRYFDKEIVDAVVALTKLDNEKYVDYLDRVRANPIALSVKLADMEDNSRSDRLEYLPEDIQEKLKKKYALGRYYLLS